jgi:hypothetical protein
MRVQLDCRLVGALITALGGVNVFLDWWHSRSSNANERLNRATAYRWGSGESVPKNGSLFLRLAGLLDVDPFALVAVADGDVLAAADDVLRIVQNAATAPPWLQFVHGFFGRQFAWPPGDLASVYFGRPWHVEDFSHDPTIRANYYATILLQHALNSPDARPQIFHFAYKQPSLFHTRWLQYRLVKVHGTLATLHHINGHTDRRCSFSAALPSCTVAAEQWRAAIAPHARRLPQSLYTCQRATSRQNAENLPTGCRQC